MSRPWGYFLREAGRQAWRQRLPTAVAVAALGLAALYGGAWMLLWNNARPWEGALDDVGRLNAYLETGLAPEAQAAARAAAQALPGVSEVDLVTPDQAAERLAGDPQIKAAMALLGDNPLPAALTVRLDGTDPALARDCAARLRGVPGVAEVDSGASGVENLLKANALARSVALVLLAAFSALALAIVGAVLRLAAWTRRRELAIMRLVGAGDSFIRAPFLLEGLLQGLLAGALASAALMALQAWVALRLRSDLGLDLAALLPRGVDTPMALALCLGTGALGLLGAAASLATLPLGDEWEGS